MPRKPKPQEPAEAVITNLRHGLTAHTIAIPGLEERADWIDHRDSIIRSLVPEGELEVELALTVAESMWRRRRVARHEQHLVSIARQRQAARGEWREKKGEIRKTEHEERAGEPPADVEKLRIAANALYGDMLVNMSIDSAIKPEPMLPAKDDLDRLMRYEAHLMRQALHALHELQALQARRRGEPAPLARVSVLGFSGA